MSTAIVYTEFGGPEVLTVADVEVPAPGPGEVTVRIEAVGVNRSAATLAGIRSRLLLIAVYAVSGLCAAIAGIIVAEQGGRRGIVVGFAEFARAGVPVALATLLLAAAWIVWLG